MILTILGILLAVLIAVIVVRTLQFKPEKAVPSNPEKLILNEEKIVADMQEMIRCKTVSNLDESLVLSLIHI